MIRSPFDRPAHRTRPGETLRRVMPWLLSLFLMLAVLAAPRPSVERRPGEPPPSDLAARLDVEGPRRSTLEDQLAEGRQRLVRYEQDVKTLLDTHRQQVSRLEGAVRALEAERSASERIIATYAAGVALLQGVVAYEDHLGRPVRYLESGARDASPSGLFGLPRMSSDATGPHVQTTFLGTGFLVSRDGAVLTNRHVVRPWDADPELREVLDGLRLTPRMTQLRAFFPGVAQPISLTLVRAAEAADVVVLRGPVPRSVPALPLDQRSEDAVPGRPVIVLGYPTGLDLLLTRVEPTLLETLLDHRGPPPTDATIEVAALLERLSRRQQIRPYPTWGRLADVQPHQLAHDAATSVGGSGGPIFATSGRVIGLTSATLQDLDGAALGVPIRTALPLLQRLPRPSHPDPVPGPSR
jgi:serine protease Do